MKVFVDTGAWLALEIKNDVNHPAAESSPKFLKVDVHSFTPIPSFWQKHIRD